MRILTHYEFENPLCFNDGVVNVLVVERPSKLFQFVSTLNNQTNFEEDGFAYSEGEKSFELHKCAEIITDFFNFELNNKKVINLLHKKVEAFIVDSVSLVNITEHFYKLKEILISNCLDFEIPITLNDDFNVSDLLKFFNLKLNDENLTLTEKIVVYVNLMIELKNLKLLLLPFIHNFLDSTEIEKIYKHCEYKGVDVVVLENYFSFKPLNCEKVIIIDDDLCEFVAHNPKMC